MRFFRVIWFGVAVMAAFGLFFVTHIQAQLFLAIGFSVIGAIYLAMDLNKT